VGEVFDRLRHGETIGRHRKEKLGPATGDITATDAAAGGVGPGLRFANPMAATGARPYGSTVAPTGYTQSYPATHPPPQPTPLPAAAKPFTNP
jgi:hypothetical protein